MANQPSIPTSQAPRLDTQLANMVGLVITETADGVPAVGFECRGHIITNPYVDESGRFLGDPRSWYGVPLALAEAMVLVNRCLHFQHAGPTKFCLACCRPKGAQ